LLELLIPIYRSSDGVFHFVVMVTV